MLQSYILSSVLSACYYAALILLIYIIIILFKMSLWPLLGGSETGPFEE